MRARAAERHGGDRRGVRSLAATRSVLRRERLEVLLLLLLLRAGRTPGGLRGEGKESGERRVMLCGARRIMGTATRRDAESTRGVSS